MTLMYELNYYLDVDFKIQSSWYVNKIIRHCSYNLSLASPHQHELIIITAEKLLELIEIQRPEYFV